MRWLWGSKDGGKDSNAWVWGLEMKSLFSILVLKFEGRSRPVYHTHAFNSISWWLKGEAKEIGYTQGEIAEHWPYVRYLSPSVFPILTWRSTLHKVNSEGVTWALTFRGPWADTWYEDYGDGVRVTLTHGRKEVNEEQ